MLVLQDEIRPFTPTVRELMEVWNLSSTSAVHRTLAELEEAGLVITRKRGARSKYYAVGGLDKREETLLTRALDYLFKHERNDDSLCVACGHIVGGHHDDCKWVEITDALGDYLGEIVRERF